MPTLDQAQSTNIDMSGYSPVQSTNPINTGSIPSVDLEPGRNVYLRCPIPPIWSSTPDTLRQFYRSGAVPQIRLFNPTK
jgi:hypothetical protein